MFEIEGSRAKVEVTVADFRKHSPRTTELWWGYRVCLSCTYVCMYVCMYVCSTFVIALATSYIIQF